MVNAGLSFGKFDMIAAFFVSLKKVKMYLRIHSVFHYSIGGSNSI